MDFPSAGIERVAGGRRNRSQNKLEHGRGDLFLGNCGDPVEGFARSLATELMPLRLATQEQGIAAMATIDSSNWINDHMTAQLSKKSAGQFLNEIPQSSKGTCVSNGQCRGDLAMPLILKLLTRAKGGGGNRAV
jgi:hypothetical protein